MNADRIQVPNVIFTRPLQKKGDVFLRSMAAGVSKSVRLDIIILTIQHGSSPPDYGRKVRACE